MNTEATSQGKIAENILKAQLRNKDWDASPLLRWLYDAYISTGLWDVHTDHTRDIHGKVIHSDLYLSMIDGVRNDRTGQSVKALMVIELKVGDQPLRRGIVQCYRYIKQFYSLGIYSNYKCVTYNLDSDEYCIANLSRDYVRRHKRIGKFPIEQG